MGQLGMGVMIGMLGGNEESVNAFKEALNKKIKSVALVSDELQIEFNDGYKIALYDDGQSCCENRYMVTDDDLTYYTNTIFKGVEIKDAPNEKDEYGEHEVQFLEVQTGKGCFTMATHNEHNGYYGGFLIRCKKLGG
ncbi:MAG: hypothetical protein PHC43_07510 [Candidatus Marinimicrobia bacterium]|jgi:hypothetical protein|nr:hypothetical protein [Candidatus Neomarinimicrobiota bacterium]